MARRTRRKTSYAKTAKSYRGRNRGSYSTRRRTRGTARGRRKARVSSAPRTVKIVIEQAPASGLTPMQAALLDQGKVVLPRKARF